MKVDPHADESTADVDPVTYSQYMEAAANAMSWEKEADRLRALLDAQMGNAYAGLVDGRKLLTHRPTSTFRVAQLVKDYPELTQHYLHSEVKQVVDMAAFVHDHPEIAESYRSRQFRSLADL